MRPTLAGEKIGSLAVTEPGGGSDVAGITTRAVRDGDHFVVNGAKTFITSGVRADFVTTAVRTGGPGPRAASRLLVIEKGTPGFSVDRSLAKMGWHCSDTAELGFTDVRVPGGQPGRRGELRLRPDRRAVRGRADRARGARLRHRRALAGPRGGVRQGAVRPSASRSPTARWSGTSWSRCTGRSRSRGPTPGRSPRRHVAGENVIAEACLAKKTAVDTAECVCHEAVQIFGGTGYMHGTEVERHYRDARILGIGGGATEVLTDLAARLLGYTA